ncbi:MAG: thiol reductant ABC exporter subunit CydC [Kineosporiaceae bacterium]
MNALFSLLPRRIREDALVRALRALDPDPKRTLFAVLAGTAALSSAVGLMATSGWLISRAAQQPPVAFITGAAVATRVFGISRGVLRYLERLVSHDVALRGVATLRERLYTRLAGTDPATVAGLRRGDLLARVGADVDTLADILVRSVLPFGIAFTTSVAAAVLVGVLVPGAGLAVAVGLLLAAVVAPWLAGLAARKAERGAAHARAETSAEILALLDGVAELRVAGAVPARLHRLDQLDGVLTQKLDAAARPSALAAAVSTLFTGATMIIGLTLAAQLVSGGQLRAVWLAVVALTPLAAAEAVSGLPAAATGLVRARAAAERVLTLVDAPPADDPGTAPDDPDRARSGSSRTGTDQTGVDQTGALQAGQVIPAPLRDPQLVAAGLACGWPGNAPVLSGVDLALAPGRRIAVVGSSGTGKTTLLLTLAGLLPPAGGTLTVSDGPGHPRDLSEVDPAVLRRTVSFTAEDAHVFTTTVRENLRVALPGAEDPQLHDVLARAGLTGWVQGLPEGLDTMLGSGGAGLSGGERRRLLLARAFLVGAGVLLLDEPGEHLDPETADVLVRDVLSGGEHRDGSGPAVLVVTHRLAPLDAADEVLVVESGAVVARGTHTALLDGYDPYRAAWEAESGLAAASR